MFIPQPDILDVLVLAAPQLAATILTVKGIASVICNNLPTQKWGKVGKVLDWLASNNKEAKKTGDSFIDGNIDFVKTLAPKKSVLGRIINSLS